MKRSKILFKLSPVTLTLTLCLSLGGCFAPKDNRARALKSNNFFSSDDSDKSGQNGNEATPTPTQGGNPTATPTPTASHGFQGYDHCNFDQILPYTSSPEIGHIRICRHISDQTKLLVKMEKPHYNFTSDSVCFVPTSKDNSNNSTALGIQTCYINQPGQILEVTLSRYVAKESDPQDVRARINALAQVPISGTMVMMYNRVQLFYNCLNADPTPEIQFPQSPYYRLSMAYHCGAVFVPSGGFVDVTLSVLY